MNTKHTKGPWRIERTVDRLYIHGNDNLGGPIDESTLVARIGFFKTEANARLIAAAPEMLATLFTILDLATKERPQDAIDEIIKYATDAVTKAEGEEK